MAGLKAMRDRMVRAGFTIPRPRATPDVLVVASALALVALASLVPPLPVLPVLSLAAIASAGVVALLAWWVGVERHSSSVTAWDVAGALAFIGFSASILTDSEQVLRLFGYEAMPK
jgi:hypothetical protein